MEEKGYNMSDPYTLGLFQVLPDYSEADVESLSGNNVEHYNEKVQKYMKDHNLSQDERTLVYTDNMYPAFAYTSVGEGKDQHMEPIPFDNTNYAEFLNKNITTEPSYELKEFLYQKAQQGKLCVQYSGFELNQPLSTFINAKGSEAQVFEYTCWDKGNKNQTMEKYDMDEDTFKTFAGNFLALADISNFIAKDLPGTVDIIQNLKLTEEKKKERIEAYTDKMKWYNTKRLVCVSGKKHPGLFKDAKSRELLNDCAQMGSKSGTYLTEKEKKIASKGLNCFISPIYNPMLNKLKKKLNKELVDIIKDGVFDVDGKPIKADSNSEIACMNALGKELAKGRELYINANAGDKKPTLVYAGVTAFAGVEKTTAVGAYINEINKLKDELLKTESGSQGSPAYEGLKKVFSTFAARLEQDRVHRTNGDGKNKFNSDEEFITGELEFLARGAREYQKNHADNWNLSYRQHERLKVASKILCLLEKRKNGDLFPQDLKTKLAEKLALEKAAACRESWKPSVRKQGLQIFTNHEALVKTMNEIKQSKEFEILANSQPEVLDAMLKAPKGQLYKGYSDFVKQNQIEQQKKAQQKQEVKKEDLNQAPKL
ncbi:MAG: hypothetical protein MJ148_00450 [Clostridia bacterium]|nr:hypothetical protein [Clostridia bacterium]